MVRSFSLVLVAALTLLSAAEVRAGRRHDGRRCRTDAQCLSGTCCNGRCSPQSACSNELAGLAALATGGTGGEVDAGPKPTGQGKPPPSEKCRNGFFCGACGVCKKGRCTGGETGRCGSCKTCSEDGSACISVPDGSGSGPDGYYSCGPDAHGGLTCCSGDCLDIHGNIDNCGACGNACTDGKSCHEIAIGVWGCTCRDWETECNGSCTDLRTDPNNCGACGNACPAGQDCSAGTCQSNCPPDYTFCGGQCVPPSPRGGGVCCEWQGSWHACAAGEQCAAYGCCDAGTQVCVGNGGAQCCYGGLVCQDGRCCFPDGVYGCPTAGGTACCSYGN